MGMVAGNGGHPQDSIGRIDTRIYGDPDEIREAAAVVRKLYEGLSDAFTEMLNSLVPMPEYWAGESADAYEEALIEFRMRTEENSDYAYRVWESMRAYAQQLDYHYRDMETIRNNARACGLAIINEFEIDAPPLLGQEPPMPAADAPMQEQDQYRADIYEYEQHKQRLRDFAELRDRARLVRYDLNEWVNKHLLSVQADSPSPFEKLHDAAANIAEDAHGTIGESLVDASFGARQRERLKELNIKTDNFTNAAQDPKTKRIRPAMDAQLAEVIEARKSYRGAASVASKVTKGLTVLDGALLAYNVATSDEPSTTAVSGIAGIAGGYAASSLLSLAPISLAVPPLAAVAGEALLVTAAAVGAGYLGKVAFEQVPLEYRERIDNTFWHLPYYVGLGW